MEEMTLKEREKKEAKELAKKILNQARYSLIEEINFGAVDTDMHIVMTLESNIREAKDQLKWLNNPKNNIGQLTESEQRAIAKYAEALRSLVDNASFIKAYENVDKLQYKLYNMQDKYDDGNN